MRFVSTVFQAILGFLLITVVWGLGAMWAQANRASPQTFPGPQAVAEKALELVQTDAFQQHIWSSLWILVYGLVPALVIGVLIGAAVGASPVARWLLGPLVITLAAAPLVVLLPLLVTWIGLGNGPKITLVFLLGMFPAANAILVRWPKRRSAAVRDVGELDDEGFPAPARPAGGRTSA